MTPPAPEGGLGALSTDRGNLPLDSVDVHASITGLAAGIEVVQGFRNPFDVPLEATYIFPLPDRAAVTGLRMEADDRVIEGVLKERGQARQDYDAAIASGRRAAIAEEDRPDVFTMRVGNIVPGERVTIRLTLDQPLPYETLDRPCATFRFPLVVAPRYIPGVPLDDRRAGAGVADDTDAVPDASRISPPVLLPGFPNPVRLSVTADIDPAGLPLTEIRSALHVVAEQEGDSGRTTVRLRPGERLDRDFVLRMSYAPHESAALTLVPDGSGEEGTFTLTVLPSGEARSRPRDVVLILDRSGSMSGWKMVAARRAAARIVDTLGTGDRFAVLSFDTVIERPRDLGPGLAEGTDRNRFRAVEHLAALSARGGTEMLAPLEEGCALLADSPRDRVLVLVTDGQVGNEDQILARLAPRLHGVRVHTVGIDRAVNASFLQRLAATGQGRCELVESEDRLDEAMDHIHHRIGAPIATGLSLHPDGLDLVPDSVAPHRLGSLFPGVPLVIAGRFRGEAAGNLTVRGTTPEGSAWQQHATGTVSKDPASASVWARAHLRDLEDRYTIRGSDALERRIVDTSLRFNVLCRFTGFVAVDSRVVAKGGATHHVVQPVEIPDGWDAPPAPAAPSAMTMMAGMAPMAAAEDHTALAPDNAPSPTAPPPRPVRGTSRAGYGMPLPPPRPPIRPGPRPGGAASPTARDVAEARHTLATELARLEQFASTEPDRRSEHLLTVLLPILESVTRTLRSHPETADLSALVTDLQAARQAPSPLPGSSLDDIWSRTIETLRTFTTAPSPLPFWKRRP
ncbi:VIT domain-containing protein [Actinomadura yumaensis]|uniref:VIT domain-containing protein n=1 Tax=Actinomadura yumaensis TaxID=111807 RepID=A0ABW2CD23_9ACTN